MYRYIRLDAYVFGRNLAPAAPCGKPADDTGKLEVKTVVSTSDLGRQKPKGIVTDRAGVGVYTSGAVRKITAGARRDRNLAGVVPELHPELVTIRSFAHCDRKARIRHHEQTPRGETMP